GIRDFHVTGVQTCALPICRVQVVHPEVEDRAGVCELLVLRDVHQQAHAAAVEEGEVARLEQERQAQDVAVEPHTLLDVLYRHVEIGRASCRGRVSIGGRAS